MTPTKNAPPTTPRKSPHYIYDAFYSPDARVRNKPARIELSRLTVRQHQNAVADLIASFHPAATWGTERGLHAAYYNSRHFNQENSNSNAPTPK